MIPESYRELIDKLSRRTNDGKVNWKSTSHEGTFIVDFREFSLSIMSGYDSEENESFVRFTILNSAGQELDYFLVTERESRWLFAYNLYSEARRKARNIDLVIGDITKELESEGPAGEEDRPFKSEE